PIAPVRRSEPSLCARSISRVRYALSSAPPNPASSAGSAATNAGMYRSSARPVAPNSAAAAAIERTLNSSAPLSAGLWPSEMCRSASVNDLSMPIRLRSTWIARTVPPVSSAMVNIVCIASPRSRSGSVHASMAASLDPTEEWRERCQSAAPPAPPAGDAGLAPSRLRGAGARKSPAPAVPSVRDDLAERLDLLEDLGAIADDRDQHPVGRQVLQGDPLYVRGCDCVHVLHVVAEVRLRQPVQVQHADLAEDAEARRSAERERARHVVLDTLQLLRGRRLRAQALDLLEDLADGWPRDRGRHVRDLRPV